MSVRESVQGSVPASPWEGVSKFHCLPRCRRAWLARVNIQGTFVMLPPAPLIAVAQAAPGGENDGDFVRNFQSGIFGQAGIVTVPFDSCYM